MDEREDQNRYGSEWDLESITEASVNRIAC